MGKAILHIHTTFSDGLATVDEILDKVEAESDIDIVGFTDHDDVRAYAAALDWKRRHPGSRVQPLWGCEVTIWGFKHLLAYLFHPPYPTTPWPKFLPLRTAVEAIHAAGGHVIIPHVDAFWVGLGRRRMLRVAEDLGILGYELLTPVPGGRRAARTLQQWAAGSSLVAVGGSDAHHLEDLFQVYVEFPGRSVADFARALLAGNVTPRWGRPRPPIPLRRQLRQHTRALVIHPSRQVRVWAQRYWKRETSLARNA
ncbi:MAG TPA: PHP-associated domain-containing protein [Chloroflexota bacterium]|nr:PHP-associated domain-containing protein [Chloroflexota bacterium]HZU04417.1 PHP-associated domain-containing protein [Chloroflexota bacterium]